MPGVRLIKKDEKLVFSGDGFKVFYRRIPNVIREEITQKYERRGKETKTNTAIVEILEYCVLGWEGFWYNDEEGKRVDIPFEKELIRAIPDDLQAKLMEKIGETDPGGVEAGNLSTTFDSKTKTEASPAGSVE